MYTLFKKSTIKKVLIAIITIFSFLIVGCKSKDVIVCSNVIEVGETITLQHNLKVNDVEWKTDNEKIAIIVDGKLITKGVGEVNITLNSNNKVYTKKIKVVLGNFDFEIIGSEILFVGSEVKFTALSNKNNMLSVLWRSSNEKAAKVTDGGIVYGTSDGDCLIYAEVFGIKKEFKIKVLDPEFDFSIIGDKTITVGESKKLEIKSDISGEVTWKSSDINIVTVDSKGNITALKEGTAIISAHLYTKTALFEIEVIGDPNEIRIQGSHIVRLDQTIFLTCNYDVVWSTSNEEIADIFQDGEVVPNSIGTVIITATDKNDSSYKATFELTVIGKTPRSINVKGDNRVSINGSIRLSIETSPSNASNRVIYSTNNPFVATVNEEGIVTGKMVGKVIITAISMENSEVYESIEIEVTLPAPRDIKLSGKQEMMQGAHNKLDIEFEGNNICEDVIWSSSDSRIAIVDEGIVLGVNKGSVTIYAKSIIDDTIYGSIDITVTKYEPLKENEEDLKKVRDIISNMTLEEKIGQMFVVGFSGMSVTSELEKAIKEYHLGNVIYMGYNVSDYNEISNLSDSIQELMVANNKIPAFISIDQEGGRVARLTKGGTHFISNMAMGATGDYQNTYLEGKAIGFELRNYGINVDFAPVLDVNNNPENPIIGIRSYSDNPLLVSLYGKNMFLGLKESNVMGCAKHFPGHGNTSVDSHYGLPTITSSRDELYQTELAPFISAACNGIDAIMTTHIIFSSIDQEYPATLSEKVLTNLLRDEIGYDGLIITDGMEMNAVSKYFGDYDKTAVLAVKAGADILTYTTTANPIKAFEGIKKAVQSGEITEERINASVQRILLKKMKYDILDNYKANNGEISEQLKENENLNIKFAMDSLTLVKGKFSGLDKSKKTLIISPITTYDLGSGLSENSFANYASNYLNENGYDCDFITVQNNLSFNETQQLLNKIKEYEQIVVAFSNVKTSKLTQTANFVKQLSKMQDKEVVVIALDTPYDLMLYGKEVNNYICVYGYQKATVIALSRYLNGEFEAQGILSVSEKNFS